MNRGFFLLEIIFAVSLLGIILPLSVSAIVGWQHQFKSIQDQSIQVRLAANRLERVLANPNGAKDGLVVTPFGPDLLKVQYFVSDSRYLTVVIPKLP